MPTLQRLTRCVTLQERISGLKQLARVSDIRIRRVPRTQIADGAFKRRDKIAGCYRSRRNFPKLAGDIDIWDGFPGRSAYYETVLVHELAHALHHLRGKLPFFDAPSTYKEAIADDVEYLYNSTKYPLLPTNYNRLKTTGAECEEVWAIARILTQAAGLPQP
jgi:hypothetical protein